MTKNDGLLMNKVALFEVNHEASGGEAAYDLHCLCPY